MVKLLRSTDKNFVTTFDTLLHGKLENDASVNLVVSEILAEVRKRGDKAVIEYTNTYDRVDIRHASELRITPEAIDEGYRKCSNALIDALNLAASRIESYHRKQMPSSIEYTDDAGVKLGFKWTAIRAVGLYVPGGLASYPSSVLMNAIPAKVAGVERLAMVVPAPEGKLNPLVLAAAKIAGVDEIYTIGGAQAVAALAYGTDTIKPVDVIVGPGNAYVAAAKRQLYGTVGIDMIAGPSEILVVSDGKSNPDWIAADLLSQAEHDTAARSILITDDEAFAQKVIQAVDTFLPTLPREKIARTSWEENGAVVIVRNLEEAIPLIDAIASEHTELAVDEPEKLAARIHNAGAIFLGRYASEALGDYVAGPSHVLPTAGTARFSSGLSVFDFLKRSSLIGCDEKAFTALAEATRLLAEAEGLGAHALSVKVRMQ